MNLQLENKTALVTGSTKGIGLAIAKALAMEGAKVIVNGRSDSSAQSAAAQIGKAVSDALGLESLGDVSFSGGQVRFGRYVGGKTYFSLSQEIAGKMGGEVSLEYQLTPQLRIDATATASGNSGVDIIWHKRY